MIICVHAFGDIASDVFSIVYPAFERWRGMAYRRCVTFSNVQCEASVLQLIAYAGNLRLGQHVVDVNFFMIFGLLLTFLWVALFSLLRSALVFTMSFTFTVFAEDSGLVIGFLRSAVVLAFGVSSVSAYFTLIPVIA